MNLTEMTKKVNAQKIAKMLKENFNYSLDVKALTPAKASKLLETVQSKIKTIRNSSNYHTAEKNPNYMKLVVLERALSQWQKEQVVEAKKDGDFVVYAEKNGRKRKVSSFQRKDLADAFVKHHSDETKNPQFKGQKLSIVNSAYKKTEEKKSAKTPAKKKVSETVIRAKFLLAEGEVDQAQAILAGQDLVDRFQKMLEDLSKMQNEELPPLASTIRDNISAEQSDAFIQSANEIIGGVLENVRTAREQLDVAVRTLAGEQVAAPMGDMGSPDMGSAAANMFGDEEADIDTGDEFGATPPAIGGEEPLGRGRRDEPEL
jgi:formylmethanofuran dehydrogenase subunit D